MIILNLICKAIWVDIFIVNYYFQIIVCKLWELFTEHYQSWVVQNQDHNEPTLTNAPSIGCLLQLCN